MICSEQRDIPYLKQRSKGLAQVLRITLESAQHLEGVNVDYT